MDAVLGIVGRVGICHTVGSVGVEETITIHWQAPAPTEPARQETEEARLGGELLRSK